MNRKDRYHFDELPSAPLIPGASYDGGAAGNVGDDPIAKLLPVGNSGGIRSAGAIHSPHLVVLYSTADQPEWTDRIVEGIVTYHGDNRTPGQGLLETPRHGNRLLHGMAEQGFPSPTNRCPFLVFTKGESGPPRSVRFNGLAIIGPAGIPAPDWLVAKWFTCDTGSFMNYIVKLQLLPSVAIDRANLQRLLAGDRSIAKTLISQGLNGQTSIDSNISKSP